MTNCYLINGVTVREATPEDDGDGLLVCEPKDLEALTMAELVTLYNASMPVRPVSKFGSKSNGLKRVWEVLDILVQRGRGTRLLDQFIADITGKHIHKLVPENPRPSGSRSAEIWAGLEDGMSVEEYLMRGWSLCFLATELRLNHLEVR
jgi:hypothetical protein